MNIRNKIENRINDLDDRWRELSVKKQRKYTLYFFLCYTVLTLCVVAKVCVETGGVDDEVAIRHIGNPIKKSGNSSQKDSITINLKSSDYGK